MNVVGVGEEGWGRSTPWGCQVDVLRLIPVVTDSGLRGFLRSRWWGWTYVTEGNGATPLWGSPTGLFVMSTSLVGGLAVIPPTGMIVGDKRLFPCLRVSTSLLVPVCHGRSEMVSKSLDPVCGSPQTTISLQVVESALFPWKRNYFYLFRFLWLHPRFSRPNHIY